jgi:uncharacterized protein
MDILSTWIVPPEATAGPAVYILVMLAALVVIGVDKGGFGGGVGILSIPLILQVATPLFAITLWLPVLVASDLATVRQYPSEWNRRVFWGLLPGSVLGILLVSLLLNGADPRAVTPDSKRLAAWMKALIALISVAFLVVRHWPRKSSARAAWQPTWRSSLPVGFLAGVTTTFAHAAGPIVTMFLLPQKMDQRMFVGTAGRYYFVVNLLKVPFMVVIGLLTLAILKYALWLIVLCPLTVWLGVWLNKHLSPTWFIRLVHVSLLITAGKLVYDAVVILTAAA